MASVGEPLRDLLVVNSGRDSGHVVLVDATQDQGRGALLELSLRVAAVRPRGGSSVAVALSAEALERVLGFFVHAPGEDDAHDRRYADLARNLPLDRSVLVVGLGDETATRAVLSDAVARYRADNPMEHAFAWAWRLLASGIQSDVLRQELDEDVLWTDVPHATGETGREQVLGWEDVQSEATWEFISVTGVSRLALPPKDVDRLIRDRALNFPDALASTMAFDGRAGVLWVDGIAELLSQLAADDIMQAEEAIRTAIRCAPGSPTGLDVDAFIGDIGVQCSIGRDYTRFFDFPFDLADLFIEMCGKGIPVVDEISQRGRCPRCDSGDVRHHVYGASAGHAEED